ncbi:MAG: prepilin peptidase [Acidimicrobiales bacterium]
MSVSVAFVLACAVVGLAAGGLVNLLVDRIPARRRLWPIGGAAVFLPPNEGRWPFPEPDDPEPAASGPGESGPGHPEAADPGPANPRPGGPDPGDPESGDPESGDLESGDLESGDAEVGDPGASDYEAGDPASLGLSSGPVAARGVNPTIDGVSPTGNANPSENADSPILEDPSRPTTTDRTPSSRAMVHVATALIFAATALHFGANWILPAYLVFFTSLLAISLIDLEHHIIPNRIVYPTIFLAVPLVVAAAALDGNWGHLKSALLGAGIAWGSMLVIHLISPGGMGFGDVRLSFILGLFLGWNGLAEVLIGLFLGFLLGAVIGMALIGLKLKTRKDHIPFGPFLAAGAALAVFFGNPIARAWLGG